MFPLLNDKLIVFFVYYHDSIMIDYIYVKLIRNGFFPCETFLPIRDKNVMNFVSEMFNVYL